MTDKIFPRDIVTACSKSEGNDNHSAGLLFVCYIDLLRGLQQGFHFFTYKTNHSLVPSLWGGSTQGNIINKFRARLFQTQVWVTSQGQIWCVCWNMYHITRFYWTEWHPKHWINFCIMFPGKIIFYWAAAACKLSFLKHLQKPMPGLFVEFPSLCSFQDEPKQLLFTQQENMILQI